MIHPIFQPRLTLENSLPLDLSVHNPAFVQFKDLGDLEDYLQNIMQGKTYGYGGYHEVRKFYALFPLFREKQDPRSHHLGVDVWAPAGTPLYTFAPARVHSFRFNDHQGDYGATIILEQSWQGEDLFALYGHLSLDSLEGLSEGQEVSAGVEFARLGPPAENGGWPPHLHFQLIRDLEGRKGDFPGVVRPEEWAYYAALCPDPTDLLFEP